MSASNGTVATTPAGSIYDLGYRHYDGARRGRLYAAWSLYVESLRGVWGFGRPVTAKAAPFICLGLYALPALFQLAFSSMIAQAIASGEDVGGLFAYHNYFSQFFFFVLVFCIAQAPEVVCRDQRHSVLPLYFTRSLRRGEYALAKLGALTSALFIFLMLPMIALFVGDVLMEKDTFAAIGTEVPKALPAIPACLLTAGVLATVSLALSSFTPRRAYAAIGLGAYVLLVEAMAAIVWGVGNQAGWIWADKPQLFGPLTAPMGATLWFFGKVPDPDYGFPPTLGADAYVLSALAGIVFFTAVLLFRYRRVSA